MAPTPLTVTSITKTGVVWPTADGQAGDPVNNNSVTNGPTLCVLVTNTHATVAQTVDFITPGTAGGYAIADDQKSLAVGERKAYGPFPTDLFGNTLEIKVSDAAVKLIPFQVVKQ